KVRRKSPTGEVWRRISELVANRSLKPRSATTQEHTRSLQARLANMYFL
ncbi:hypothetical protein A2U01_0088776, partial [Trifolium medium]|nr:hypothetical protein [Trifolium medium]